MRAQVVLSSLLLSVMACKCDESSSSDAAAPISAPTPEKQRVSGKKVFAEFRVDEVKPRPAVKSASIAPDLSNVELAALLTPEQRAKIAANGFVVSPGRTKEFYELYERARDQYVPIFVTSDSLLHIYHLLFDKTLRRVEAARLAPRLIELDNALLEISLANITALEGGTWADAAKRTAAYFAVAKKLLAPESMVSPAIAELVEEELAQIKAHAGVRPSALFPAYDKGEDWSQYVARGHYAKSEELTRYFLAMTWHGRMTFRASELEETKSAALLLYALERAKVAGRPARELWMEIYEPTTFFTGQSDDLTPSEYEPAYRAAFGVVKTVADVADDSKVAKFQAELRKLRRPEILSMPISDDDPGAEPRTHGLRFMAQRFAPDAFVFRRLVHPNVPKRHLPKGLDLFGVLGSDRAREIAEDSREYRERADELRELFRGFGRDTYGQSLYWAWIYSLLPLLEAPSEGYPVFMQSDAWVDKQLTTVLASWTELKHDTLLESEPIEAETGAGGLLPPEPIAPKGWVEPVPEVFARIVGLAEMTRVGLSRRGLLDGKDTATLEKLEELGKKLGAIALKQLIPAPVSAEEYEFIRLYGGAIEKLTFASMDEIEVDSDGSPEGGGDLEAAIVADVATDPSGHVLEEAIGRVFNIYVAVPIDGKLVLAEGGVFSHYEFVEPIDKRLTDEAWKKRVEDNKTPPLAEWTSSYVARELVSQEAADRVRALSEMMINHLWATDALGLETVADGVALERLAKQKSELRARREFIGRQRLSFEFVSFDFKDAGDATITTRERWKDDLNQGDPEEEDLTKIGERGPYEIVVTYTLKKKDGIWMITNLIHRPELPEWRK